MANNARYAPSSKTSCRGRDGTGGHPGRGDDGAGALPASSLRAPLDEVQTLDVLSEYVKEAQDLFVNDHWVSTPIEGAERAELIERGKKDD